jgi:Protein of unknown function (DUF4012)
MARTPLRTRPVAVTLLLLAVVLVLASAVAAYRMFRVSRDLTAGRNALIQVEPRLRATDLAGARQLMTTAQYRVVRARSRLRGPDLSLINLVPIAHQNLAAVRRSVDLSLKMVDAGSNLLHIAAPLANASGTVEVPLRSGAIPLNIVTALRDQAQALAATLPSERNRPSGLFLLPPVQHLQNIVFDEAVLRHRQFNKVGPALDLLSDMSGANGPRRYMLAVANEAEMRGTGGMILSYGTLLAENGKFTLDRFGQIDQLKLQGPVRTAVPPDYYSQYRPVGPTELWRSVNYTADFAVAAPIMEAMYGAATNTPVDGVVQIDSTGLAAILAGIGPIDVPDVGYIDATNVERVTLNEAYTLFPDRPARQEVLTNVAQAAFHKLVTGDYPTVRVLAQALVAVVDQRHVILHSVHKGPQRSIVALGADGYLPDPRSQFVHMTVQNVSANKLDYYVDTELRLRGQWHQNKHGKLHAEIEVRNTAPPDGRPPYVFGPGAPSLGQAEYRGWVTLYLPAGARILSSGGSPENPPWLVSEVERSAVHFVAIAPPGGRNVVTVDLELPPRLGQRMTLQLVPSPRLRPTTLAIDFDDGSRGVRETLPLTKVRTITGGR